MTGYIDAGVTLHSNDNLDEKCHMINNYRKCVGWGYNISALEN